ncbi:MAG TPA: FAD:protein FMN transferase [Polyangiales bacterium]|nr:FAD:protein FMN transferase [Polyangiales bacterium]
MPIQKLRDSAATAPAERQDRLMGTTVTQRVYGLDGTRCCALAHAEITRLERLWSVFLPSSEVNELARRAGVAALKVAPDTAAIISEARALHEFTDGAFDVTTAPLTSLWRAAAARGKLPTPHELEAAHALVNGQDLELTGVCDAELRRAGQRVDFGAIGKGYAADRCIAIYREHGIRHALIDLGGNVAVLGGKPDGSCWRVGLQSPGRPRGEPFGWLDVRDTSVVTSGNYERGYAFGGERYGHLLDPRSSTPLTDNNFGVTVVNASSTLADALSTALLVMGSARGFDFALEHGIEVVMFDSGVIRLTPGLSASFGMS